MKKSTITDLPVDYALVLQQIGEHGKDELVVLSETLNIRRSRLVHIIGSLRKKGLIRINRSNMGDAWVQLSARGQKIVKQIWPEHLTYTAYA